MLDNSIDYPWNHPERSDWNKVVHRMVTQIQAGVGRRQLEEELPRWISENRLDFRPANISNYLVWLCREFGPTPS